MILTPSPPRRGSAGDRLLRALAERGHAVGDAASPSTAVATLFVCPAPDEPAPDLRAWRAAQAQATAPRLLLVTRLGTHPDAAHPRLRECWVLEEAARGAGLPLLVLRLGFQFQGKFDLNEWYQNFAGPDIMGSLVLGMGIKLDIYEIDYAYRQYGVLGSTHRIGLTLNFK